jgi:hypothetical protein
VPLSRAFLVALLVTVAQAPALRAQNDSARTTLGGYGEIHYTNDSGHDTPGGVNVKRFVLYLGHSFSDRISFHSEIELEDARIEGGEDGGELALEQAYLDFADHRDPDRLVLIPSGSSTRPTSRRPSAWPGRCSSALIPTTWREVSVVGRLNSAGLLRLYLVNGLTADGFGYGRIRGGRQGGHEATFVTPAHRAA